MISFLKSIFRRFFKVKVEKKINYTAVLHGGLNDGRKLGMERISQDIETIGREGDGYCFQIYKLESDISKCNVGDEVHYILDKG